MDTKSVITIACDFSENALKRAKEALPETQTMCFDMTKGLPFEDNFSDLVISDLSLHYFNNTDTIHVIQDIRRVLRSNGTLLCRVNSIQEFEKYEIENENRQIESGVYQSNKGIKHFFDRADVEKCFADLYIKNLSQTLIHKYDRCKYAWEIYALKVED